MLECALANVNLDAAVQQLAPVGNDDGCAKREVILVRRLRVNLRVSVRLGAIRRVAALIFHDETGVVARW